MKIAFLHVLCGLIFFQDTSENSSLFFTISLAFFLTGFFYPQTVILDRIRSASFFSIGGIVLYTVLSTVLFYLRYNVSERVEKMHQKKLGQSDVIHDLLESKTMDVRDSDVIEESDQVVKDFDLITPEHCMDYCLAICGLTKVFPKSDGYKRVFNDISFAVRYHDVFGLLGPNGAGKTTLINILSGKMSANLGEFKIFGHSSDERRVIRQLIGVVPQFDVFYGDLTVEEHFILMAKLHGVSKSQRNLFCRDVGELVGLDHDSYRMKASVLSGGQKRRLTLGMAMVSKPKLVFLDEPTV